MSNPTPNVAHHRPWLRRPIVLGMLGLALLAGAWWVVDWVAYRFTHSISKDAFIESHLINVAPQVAGTVVNMLVQEQQRVTKGQLLALIDPSTYQHDVDVAAAKQAVAEAALQKARADLDVLAEEVPKRIRIADLRLSVARENEGKARDALEMVKGDTDKAVDAAQHGIDAARAAFVLAREDYARYGDLYKDGSVSQRRFQEATKAYQTTQADVKIAEAKLGQAEANRKQVGIATQALNAATHTVAEGQAALALAKVGNQQIEAVRKLVAERERAVTEAKSALDLAKVSLGYTRVLAPYDGVIAKKWRHLGDYSHKGDPVFSMYNPDLLYVTVQLEETLLEGVNPGNWADLRVDAYRQPFRGRVLWIGSATGANFSLIPRDVSSGEFTYVVQRVPTRIAIERDERWPLLKPGLSVRVAIEHGPGDPAWAAEGLRKEAEIEGIPERKP
jgi:membrane fusion protein (multidrug efflux system)